MAVTVVPGIWRGRGGMLQEVVRPPGSPLVYKGVAFPWIEKHHAATAWTDDGRCLPGGEESFYDLVELVLPHPLTPFGEPR
jgi:hypothetical protein